MQGAFVLENKKGQVVRTINWKGRNLSLIYREDQRRIEPVESTKHLDDEKIPYTCFAKVTKEEVKKNPVEIANVGRLRFVEEISQLSPSVEVHEESDENLKKSFTYTAAVHLFILGLAFIIGHFAAKSVPEQEEQRVVKIAQRQKIVAPMTHHSQHTRLHAAVKPKRSAKIAQIKKALKSQKAREVSLNNMGALAVLGSMNKSSQQGGLNLNAIQTSRGPGLGGTQGSGGVQTSIYGKGLIGAPLGPQARATGAGGYGTRGKGGGQAGYGELSLVGSGSRFFQPVEAEASIEGGLDRDEIAEVIQRHLGQIRYCYEHGLQMKPALSGRVAVRFMIAGSGFVSTAQVSNTSLHSNDVEGCIVGHLKSWKFPQPRGGVIVKVTYPFVLKRVSQT